MTLHCRACIEIEKARLSNPQTVIGRCERCGQFRPLFRIEGDGHGEEKETGANSVAYGT